MVRLRPAPHCRARVEAYSLTIRPSQHFLNWQQDPFGNWHARLVFPKPADVMEIEVDLVVEMTAFNPFDFFLEEGAEELPLRYAPELRRQLLPYLEAPPPGPLLAKEVEHARSAFARPGRRTVDVLVDINRRVNALLRYDIRMEPGVLTPEQTLAGRHGSCRDFAWLLGQLLRHLGFATRFASGYSIQLKPDVKPIDGPVGVAEDVTDLHAWTEVFLPGAGWVGLDATSGLMCGEGHIPLACTPDPEAAAPISGSYLFEPKVPGEKVKETFDVAMSVRRLREEPRVTKPYTEDEWARIDALGERIDRELAERDVRLSMGGEPTFVSIDDPDGAEWNVAALGPGKRRVADQLVRRLHRRFAPGGVLHHGQGKWYPGETLPRWAIGCYWRKDGIPVWRNPALLATDDGSGSGSGSVDGDGGGLGAVADQPAAAAFITELATRLGLDPHNVTPGYEDTTYYLWREHKLPANVTPGDSRLDDEEERARLARVFDRGLGQVVGYALLLRRKESAEGDGAGQQPRWESARWAGRREHLYLVPGDSAMGYRLPLDGLAWAAPDDRQLPIAMDPLAARPPLPERFGSVTREQVGPGARLGLGPSAAGSAAGAGTGAAAARGKSAAAELRTALCVEPRQGMLNVFLPPLGAVEDYLELVAAIEDVAASLGTPVRLEGYPPASDHRLRKLEVTPDPGVLEVNVHPALSWKELRGVALGVYEDARQCRLTTEKFELDGRHSGTGGGNHVVLGGPTPADSPLLRRPDLLRSIVGYWNNHPSLSYLFSGLFIGPTSQAPRMDEARQDSLAELEIAFGQLDDCDGNPGRVPKPSRDGLGRASSSSPDAISGGVGAPPQAPAPPWLVDRLFRNLLVDVTGNTHRAELCVDKLYSPDAASGRQGLLEMRGFEMPPDPRMSLTQQLLVRALVAWFWRAPYRRPLVRWGTALHDRFMLPHFVSEDFDDVLFDLARAGFRFDRAWFAPHHEFRFPRLGAVSLRSVELELRQAIEPWHVLGEQGAIGGTVRYVDSSLERVQIKATNLTGGRYVVTCNGRRLPLSPTGTTGEYVAGVRFRAWQPPEALHPTIGVHAPLVFDVIDTWNEATVGGFTYHVAHPGGLAFHARPRNALEAESRRASRFEPIGRTSARAAPAASTPAVPGSFHPLTLDLRT